MVVSTGTHCPDTLNVKGVYVFTSFDKDGSTAASTSYYYSKIKMMMSYRHFKSEYEYIKGDKLIELATSTNSQKYETGKRNSDGYWYISLGIQ